MPKNCERIRLLHGAMIAALHAAVPGFDSFTPDEFLSRIPAQCAACKVQCGERQDETSL